MIKLILTILILTTWTAFSTGQNLIPNYSFEQYDTCPDMAGRIQYAYPWFQTGLGTSDYYNVCDTIPSIIPPYSPEAGIPYNWIGTQNARTGIGYAGFSIFAGQDWSLPNYREYIEVKLVDSLIAGQKYFIQFYVSLADSSTYATDDIGLYVSTDSVLSSNYYNLPFVAQISNPNGNIISNIVNWTLISGNFIATGGEKFITIGGFKNDTISDTTAIANPGTSELAYYYIDDVFFYPDTITNLNDQFLFNNYKIYPNPTNQSATLEFNNSAKDNCTLTLYDTFGRLMQTIKNILADKVEIERQNLTSGLYFFQLRTDKQIIATGKLTFE